VTMAGIASQRNESAQRSAVRRILEMSPVEVKRAGAQAAGQPRKIPPGGLFSAATGGTFTRRLFHLMDILSII
ncbi:MAG: hypothetical protein ACRD4G_08265, partial [Bryobacteraceae bacterium]